MNKNEPKNRDIYKILKKINGIPFDIIDEILTENEGIIYKWLLDNGYIIIDLHTEIILKKEFKQKVFIDECIGILTLDGKQVPSEWYISDNLFIVLITNKGNIFLNNFSDFKTKIELINEDYPFLISTISGFIGGIISSLLLYIFIGK
ncbi:hypothetical protein M0P65_02245 [Candidatus Gracilibacteria bacterium]|nr:hypothetical protein [Candidatus Gracilibacteria bacterium]